MSEKWCPAMRENLTCTYGEDFGPCDACSTADQVDLYAHGVPLPDYAEARAARMAAEIKRLQASVAYLTRSQKREAK